MPPPILDNKVYKAPSVFTVENLLREARRQKAIPPGDIPAVCILDPDGDIAEYVVSTGQAMNNPHWACYHTKLYTFTQEGIEYGIVPHVVGGSFAVLVAEELFSSGCQFLISMTSAGQIVPIAPPPYFVLIERALRDEGTSYHYLPPTPYSTIDPVLRQYFNETFDSAAVRVLSGATWTTDAPFRETAEAIAYARSEGILGVGIDAAALYAFAEVNAKAVICFAHVTNVMGQVEGDFEKGLNQGSHDALNLIHMTAAHWLRWHPAPDRASKA